MIHGRFSASKSIISVDCLGLLEIPDCAVCFFLFEPIFLHVFNRPITPVRYLGYFQYFALFINLP